MTAGFPKLDGRIERQERGSVVFADVERAGNVLRILHVEAPQKLRGTGAAGRFMEALAAQARSEGLKLQPICSYAKAWLERSPHHKDLLAG